MSSFDPHKPLPQNSKTSLALKYEALIKTALSLVTIPIQYLVCFLKSPFLFSCIVFEFDKSGLPGIGLDSTSEYFDCVRPFCKILKK